jgi:predicted ATPase/DNA-binding SARP family transcriptional activator/Tfp pilus assembly protein PilF
MLASCAENTSSFVEIRLFGPMEVLVHGDPLPRLRSRKGQWLLALLALRQGRAVPRDWLAGTLWPESGEGKGLFNLRQTLADLRRALGPAAGCLRSPTPHLLCLGRGDILVDVAAFDAAITAGDPTSLEKAIALYRGPLLEGCQEEWAVGESAAREQAYLSALEALAALAAARNDLASAVRCLRRIVAVDPLRETVHGALMQALADCGDTAAVTQVYRDLRLLLHRELNAAPSPETEALYQRLRAQAQQTVCPPERPLRQKVPTPPRRLPIPLNTLIGREHDIEAVVGWLGAGRLLTLTGAGGVGKTRLAIAVGEALVESSPDGVWFVELASLADPALVAQTVARTLGVREEAGRPLTETLADLLASRSLVLILDNCEHLLSTCVLLADSLLRACGGLRLLATSREPLGLFGERVYRVPSLALPPAAVGSAHPGAAVSAQTGSEKDVNSLLEYAAVRLFIERALMAQPSFRLTRQNVGIVVQVCGRLDGIPLAIELAAARLRAMPIEQIATHLNNCFHLLTGGSRTALPRQQTLRALIDWSYDLLTEPECTLLRRLAVFAGGWTLEAAEAVCADRAEEVLDLLTSLVDKSLVMYEAQEGQGRYRLLETVWQYARDRLEESGEGAVVSARHYAFILALVEKAEPKLYGSEAVAWFDRLETEHDNLRTALEWGHADRDSAETQLRLVGALGRFWDTRGYLREGQEHLARALSRMEAAAPTVYRAYALLKAGWIALLEQEYAAAHAFADEALAIYRALEEREGSRHCLFLLGSLVRAQGDLTAAKAMFEEYLALSEPLDHEGAAALMSLGHIAEAQDDYAAACRLFEEALTINRKVGNLLNIAGCLKELGWYACREGDYPTARSRLAESLILYQQIGSNLGVVWALERCASLSATMQQFERAARLRGAIAVLREALSMSFAPDHRSLAATHAALGEAAFTAAWEEGHAMLLEQAVEYALSDSEQEPADRSIADRTLTSEGAV